MTSQPFTSNEIANAMRESIGNEDWRGIPLGVRYRLIKAARTLLAELAVRLDDERAAELTYDDGYGDGWDDGRLAGHYWEWGQQQSKCCAVCPNGGIPGPLSCSVPECPCCETA